jgi:phosphoribosylformylglycinamidine synthase
MERRQGRLLLSVSLEEMLGAWKGAAKEVLRESVILKAPGTNRDFDVQLHRTGRGCGRNSPSFRASRSAQKDARYGVLVVPGGFSYGDALGAGTLFALDLSHFFEDEVRRFVEEGRPCSASATAFRRS